MASGGRKTKRLEASIAEHRAVGRPLTARAVAELCGVELKTVHNWVADGRLSHFRTPGRHLRFHPDVVHTFLQECGYEVYEKPRRRVVSVEGPLRQRLRRALADTDCTWVPDVWGALIVSGKQTPDLIVIDGSSQLPRELDGVLLALRRELPTVAIIVIDERGGARRSRGAQTALRGGIEVLTRWLVAQPV